MITKTSGFYAINQIATVVNEGLFVTFRDDAEFEEFASLKELYAAYPPPAEEFGGEA